MSENYAAGRVCTGFSYPVVALYQNAGGVVSHTGGRELARGVDVNLNINTSDNNTFYANNVASESENGRFSGGTVGLTVDGLHGDAERMIYGIPEPAETTFGEKKIKVTKVGDSAEAPYVGIGIIVRYMSAGHEIYVPVVFPKTKFRQLNLSAKTQDGPNLSWQTQALTADLHRDDSADHDWKWVCEDQTTEADARAVLDAILNVVKA